MGDHRYAGRAHGIASASCGPLAADRASMIYGTRRVSPSAASEHRRLLRLAQLHDRDRANFLASRRSARPALLSLTVFELACSAGR